MKVKRIKTKTPKLFGFQNKVEFLNIRKIASLALIQGLTKCQKYNSITIVLIKCQKFVSFLQYGITIGLIKGRSVVNVFCGYFQINICTHTII